LSTVRNILKEMEAGQNQTEQLAKIGRSVHLVKGNASLLSLSFFADRAHIFEDKIAVYIDKEKLSQTDIKTLSYYLDDMHADLNSLVELLNKIGKILDQMRLQPEHPENINDPVIRSFENLIQQNGKEQNKEIRLVYDHFNFSDIPRENQILAKEIIIQLVRNSIAHGIETSEERAKFKKDPIAKIEIKTLNTDKYFGFAVRDDGRGIQLDKLKEKALASSKYSDEDIAGWDNNTLLNLIFQSGISTSETASKISGRGVGMDLVNEKVLQHNGMIKINYENLKFCEFEILIPKN